MMGKAYKYTMNKMIPIVAATMISCSSQEPTAQPCCEKNFTEQNQDVHHLLRSLGAAPATKQETCEHEDGDNFSPNP
jgi:hypothetical protein